MFNNIIGNEENKKLLANIIENNSISHSYIFSGICGIGKFLFAQEFANKILYLNSNEENYTQYNWQGIKHPDLTIVDEKTSSIKTEVIKKISNDVFEKPTQGKKKIYIINNSENMSREAQNSLLKTLEEPPEYIVIILITKNENLLLNTIRSRCTKIRFHQLSINELKKYFQNTSEIFDEEVLDAAGGSISRAIELKEDYNTYKEITNLFYKIENLDELSILKIKDILIQDKEKIFSILDYINIIFTKKIINNKKDAIKYNECIKIIEETKIRLIKNSNLDMTIDNCLFAIERSLR